LKILGGLDGDNIKRIDEKCVRLSNAEKNLVTSWQSPAGMAADATPPGRGNFLIKIVGRPGIPIHLRLTQTELTSGVSNTNAKWEAISNG
jgi:hypothetical protein